MRYDIYKANNRKDTLTYLNLSYSDLTEIPFDISLYKNVSNINLSFNYFIQFRQNAENPSITEAVQFAIFKAIPSVSYKFKFPPISVTAVFESPIPRHPTVFEGKQELLRSSNFIHYCSLNSWKSNRKDLFI